MPRRSEAPPFVLLSLREEGRNPLLPLPLGQGDGGGRLPHLRLPPLGIILLLVHSLQQELQLGVQAGVHLVSSMLARLGSPAHSYEMLQLSASATRPCTPLAEITLEGLGEHGNACELLVHRFVQRATWLERLCSSPLPAASAAAGSVSSSSMVSMGPKKRTTAASGRSAQCKENRLMEFERRRANSNSKQLTCEQK